MLSIQRISISFLRTATKSIHTKNIFKSVTRLKSDTPARQRYGSWGEGNSNRRINSNYNNNNNNDDLERGGGDFERDENRRSWSSSGRGSGSGAGGSMSDGGSRMRRPGGEGRGGGGYNEGRNWGSGGGGGDRDRERGGGRSSYYDDVEKREPVYGYYEGDHIYGVTSVLAAISSNRRNITELLVQIGMDTSNKKDEKAANDILRIAKERGIKVREFPKHDLNMLTENRPHQGFVLRAHPIEFIRLDSMPLSNDFKCVLALDEVWDPQNFGALLRSSQFLGVDSVVVCAKNSAPLSPTVSKASAGAMEVMNIHSTDNLMKFLDKSVANGWQVIGTALSNDAIELYDTPVDKPTIIVLGNEGHGIRTNILRRCTHLVKISSSSSATTSAFSSSSEASGVDSLNVSVTGGIILHHILNAGKRSASNI